MKTYKYEKTQGLQKMIVFLRFRLIIPQELRSLEKAFCPTMNLVKGL